LFADQDAEIATIGNNPNGTNINDGYGSTHPEKMQALVKEKGLDVGLSFDGDGDRLIAVDEKGNILDGVIILYVCAKYLKEYNQLENDTIVMIVQTNNGSYEVMEKNSNNVVSAGVRDRYVIK